MRPNFSTYVPALYLALVTTGCSPSGDRGVRLARFAHFQLSVPTFPRACPGNISSGFLILFYKAPPYYEGAADCDYHSNPRYSISLEDRSVYKDIADFGYVGLPIKTTGIKAYSYQQFSASQDAPFLLRNHSDHYYRIGTTSNIHGPIVRCQLQEYSIFYAYKQARTTVTINLDQREFRSGELADVFVRSVALLRGWETRAK